MLKRVKIIIPRPKVLEKKKAIFKGKPEKFYVVSDFDGTLTKTFYRGEKLISIMAGLRNGNYLTPEYARKANALFRKYHRVERNPNFPQEEKKEIMREWWTKHFKLIIKSGLRKEDLADIIEKGNHQFRQGFLKFVSLLGC